MIHHDVVAYSPLYWELRRGRPTASEMHRILSPGKAEPSRAADGYIRDLIEELSPAWHPPVMTERVANPAMRHGIECEPEARAFYAMLTDNATTFAGFCTTDDGRFGCSPDGLADDGERLGLLELKCPQPETHRKYLADGVLPTQYRCQVHGQLIVTGLPFVDFMSYCEFHPPLLVRVEPDSFTKRLKTELDVFWGRYMAALERAKSHPEEIAV